MKDVLLSIKPKYAAMIYAGTKTTEYRRGLPDSALYWSRIYIYESSPVRKVTGSAILSGVMHGEVDRIWRWFQKGGGISYNEYSEYMIGAFSAWGLAISKVNPFAEPLPLSSFGIDRPPQSWRYIYH